jgi:hypothetical protein
MLPGQIICVKTTHPWGLRPELSAAPLSRSRPGEGRAAGGGGRFSGEAARPGEGPAAGGPDRGDGRGRGEVLPAADDSVVKLLENKNKNVSCMIKM